jgi:hypothetical protein
LLVAFLWLVLVAAAAELDRLRGFVRFATEGCTTVCERIDGCFEGGGDVDAEAGVVVVVVVVVAVAVVCAGTGAAVVLGDMSGEAGDIGGDVAEEETVVPEELNVNGPNQEYR